MRAPLVGLGLVVGSAVPLASQAVIRGVVRDDSAGAPLRGVEVVLEGSARRALTDEAGRYLLDAVRPGSYVVLIRMVGYRAVREAVRAQAGDTVWLNVTLARAAQVLPPVTVETEPRIPRGVHLRTFEENRRLGFGKFFDSTYLRRFDHHRVGDIIQRVPGVQLLVAGGGACPKVLAVPCFAVSTRKVRTDGRLCDMAIFVDGWPSRLGDLSRDWQVWELDGIEVYRSAAAVPAEYNSANSACGVIALWTRRPSADSPPPQKKP